MSDAKIETMVMITGREYEALRAEVERLKAVEADYDLHEREMIDLEEDNGRLRARVDELEVALERIDRIEVYDEDARETLRAKLGVMRDIARSASTQEKRK